MRKLLWGSFFGILILSGIFFVWPLRTIKEPPEWFFYDRFGKILYHESLSPKSKAEIDSFFSDAIIALEDQNFYQHFGIDPKALVRSTFQYFGIKEGSSGGSTIPMQLGKLLYLSEAKHNLWYKIRQILYALKLEQKYSKEEILKEYLEKIPLGNATEGFEEAAFRYFGKETKSLNISQKALLLGIRTNPSAFNPLNFPERALENRNKTLDELRTKKLIKEEEVDFWKSQKLDLHPHLTQEIRAPHWVFFVEDYVKDHYQIPAKSKEIHVTTTLNLDLYESMLRIARGEIRLRAQKANLSNAAVVVINNKSGEIESLLGSINFFDQEKEGFVNMALAKRETGSVLKPFLYGEAIELGMSPSDEIVDEMEGFTSKLGSYHPRNFQAQEMYGRVRMREALANSYNLSAVWMLEKIGIPAFNKTLERGGIILKENAESIGLPLILGSGQASLLHLTNGFRSLAEKGMWSPPKLILKVEDSSKNPLALRKKPEIPHPLFSRSTAEWLTNALSDNAARWPIFGQHNWMEVDQEAAAKSGTSQAFRDNWVIGYSPDYSIGVWAGNTDGTPMRTTSGVEGAGPIWNKVFRLIHEKRRKAPFLFTSERKSFPLCRRPYEKTEECSEKFTEFLTSAEIKNLKITQKPKIKIAFPQNGDHFHPQSPLSLRAINTKGGSLQFWMDGQKIPPVLESIPQGSHTLWVTEAAEKSESIEIKVGEDYK